MQNRSSRIAFGAFVVVLALLLAACPAVEVPSVDETLPAESYAPGQTGEIREVSVVLPGETQPTTLTVEVFDGLAIYQGDIILGEIDPLSPTSVVISGSDPRWPNATVPYVIDANLSSTLTTRVEAAVQHWNDRTNVTLVERDGEDDYVEFTPGSGCSSKVGRKTGGQSIFLASGCSTGNVIHEIGHAIGFWHEQSRSDRDTFVEVLIDNVQEDKTHNFDLHDDDGTDVGDYDYGSIMHYPSTAFGKLDSNGNRLTTIRTIPPGSSIGQRTALSGLDVESANRLYPTEPTPYIVIEGPGSGLDEWDDLSFSATVVDDIGVALGDYTLTWSYDQWNGVPFFFDTTASGETTSTINLCDGTYTVDVVARHADGNSMASDSAIFTVANGDPKPARCGWSVDIVDPYEDQTFTTADTVRIRAVIDDDHPETDEPLSTVVWRLGLPSDPDSLIIQTGAILDFRRSDKWSAGTQVLHVDYGGEASDSISFEIVETSNTAPTVTILSPSDGDTVSYLTCCSELSYLAVPVEGSANDVEDGPLSGLDVTWSWRVLDDVLGDTEWRAGDTGLSGELAIPLSSVSDRATIEIRLMAEDSNGLTGFEVIEVLAIGAPL